MLQSFASLMGPSNTRAANTSAPEGNKTVKEALQPDGIQFVQAHAEIISLTLKIIISL